MYTQSPLRPGAPETPAQSSADLAQPIFRHVYGEQFDLLLECIADRIADEPRLRLEGQAFAGGHPMLFAANQKELKDPANRGVLEDLSLSRDDFMRRLAERVPSLRQERPARFTYLSHSTTRRGVHFFELELDERGSDDAYDERIEVWRAMQGIASTRLRWKPHAPNVTLVYGANNPEPLAYEEVEPLKNYVRAHLPIEGVLSRVVDGPGRA
jgi:hypothetical protein